MPVRLGGLWRHPDFVKLWSGETISVFGSLITRTALPFTAILVLHARPFQISLLAISELVPGFAVGLVAGVWVDRVRRRPIMIAADIGRAALLVSIPVAAFFDLLGFPQLYAVSALASVLTVFFDVAYRSYLPTLVDRDELVEGNSKLSASASVSEVAAFGTGGWLVQVLSAPGAILVDALSFVASAIFVARIRAPEPPPPSHADRRSAWREAEEGLGLVLRDPILRGLTASHLMFSLARQIFGTVLLLYLTGLGFEPGALGLIFAVGGVSALFGALIAGRAVAAARLGPALVGALLVTGLGQAFIPLAAGVTVVAVVFLVSQQLLGDAAATVYEINDGSLRQAITPDRFQGRVNATSSFLGFGAMVIGAILGGVLGTSIGLRATLVVGVAGTIASAGLLFVSPVRRLRQPPALAVDGTTAPVEAD